MKILSHYHWYFLQKKFTILVRFAKSFPTKRKPSKCSTKEKKGGKKSKRSREERKQKVKDERAAKLSLKNNYLEILLSAHARTLKAVIWHQEQKLVQCSTCKQQPRPQGLLDFQNGGSSGEDPGTQQITCLQRGWRCIQNGGYREKGEKNWVRDAKVKINKMAEKAEVQFKKK